MRAQRQAFKATNYHSFPQADFSLPIDRDMEYVWTLKHLDKTNWQRSSSVQIKPPQRGRAARLALAKSHPLTSRITCLSDSRRAVEF